MKELKPKELKPLVLAYARDMKVLLVDDVEVNIEFYKVAFGKYFNVCDTAHDGQEALEMYNQNKNYYDLIVTDVEMPKLNGLELIEAIRAQSLQQSIIVITAVTDIDINQSLAFHHLDGLLTKPVDSEKLFTLLYRVLKKIAEKKELSMYMQDLEDAANQAVEYKLYFELIIKKLKPAENQKEVKDVISLIKTLIGKSEVAVKENIAHIEKIQISSDIKKDIRFTNVEHVSAKEFVQDLDDSIFDKVDDFADILEDMVVAIHDFRDAKDESSIAFLEEVISNLSLLSGIIDNIGLFPIISRSIINLLNFLKHITYDDISVHGKGELLAQMLLGVEDDLGKWSRSIFLERDASNVHYLDASIANNVLEIESIFNDNTLESDEDEEDLEFF